MDPTGAKNDKLLGIGIVGLILIIGTVLLVVGAIIGSAVLYLFVDDGDVPEGYRVGRIMLSRFNSTTYQVTFDFLVPVTKPSQVNFLIERNGNESSYIYNNPTRAWLVNGTDEAGTGQSLVFFDLAADGDIDKGDYTLIRLQLNDDCTVRVIDAADGYEVCRYPMSTG